MFPLFYKPMALKLARKMAVIFSNFVNMGSFPECCRSTDVVLVPKEFSFADVRDYELISISPLLPKVFEKIVARILGHFFAKKQSVFLFSVFV